MVLKGFFEVLDWSGHIQGNGSGSRFNLGVNLINSCFFNMLLDSLPLRAREVGIPNSLAVPLPKGGWMKNLLYNLDSKINQSFSLQLNTHAGISEQQILALQDLFLTNGVHYIGVSSIKEGRTIIYKFLEALRCYQSVACFTIDGITLKKSILDLHKQLLTKNIDRFLVEEFNSDFLWIEQENFFMQNCLRLEEKIFALGLDQHMPIIILSPFSTAT